MGADSLANLIVHVGADLSDFNKEMDKFQRNVNKISGQLTQAGSGLTQAVTVPLLAIGGAATKTAMDAVESENLFETSLGGMAKAAREWSDQTSDALGLNAYELRENTGLLYTMFQSMKLGQKDALTMSEGLTQLAYDMASFYNVKPDEAFEKLRSGISGESEPLKQLGILVDETTVKTYAYTHGIAAQGAELTNQQKVMARYGAIMEQTKTAQGDLARTIDSPTNQLRVMSEQVKQTAIDFGTSLIPMVQEAMAAARPLVDKIREWVKEFSNLDDGTKRTIIEIALFAAALGPALLAVGKIMQAASGLVTVVRTLTGALATLAANPIALTIAAAAALGVGIYELATAHKRAEEEAYRESESLLDLTDKYGQAKSAMDNAKAGSEEYKVASDQVSQSIQEIGDKFPELVKRWDEHGNAVEIDTQKLRENTQAARENKAAHDAKSLADKQREANDAYASLKQTNDELQRQKDQLTERMQKSVQQGLVSQAEADKVLADEFRDLEGAFSKDLQSATQAYDRAVAEVAKMSNELYGANNSDWIDQAINITAVPGAAGNGKTATSGAGTGSSSGAPKPDKYLSGFETMWEQTTNAATKALDRAQQDQLTALKNAQAQSEALKRAELAQEQTLYENSLDDQLTTFKDNQGKAKVIFENGLRDRRQARQAELDTEVDDLRAAQAKELQAISDRYDQEQALRNGELAAKLKAKQAEIDKIRQAEEDEANARQRSDLVKRITQAEEDIQKARWTKIPAKIQEAEENLSKARQDLADFDLRQQRQAAVAKLQTDMEAIREEYRLKDQQADKDQKAETERKQAEQKAALEAKQAENAQKMQAFNDELAEEQRQFDITQAQELTNEQRRLEGLKVANKNRLDEKMRGFLAEQAQAETNFKRAQDDQAAQYKTELDALHTHLSDKLAEQQTYVNNVAALKAQADALLQTMPAPSLPGGGGFDAVMAAKSLAGQGKISEAAQLLSSAWNIPLKQAEANLQNIPKLAAGGIATRPTLALIGEAGPEPVMPLGTLWERLQTMALSVAQTVVQAASVGGELALTVPVMIDGQELGRAAVKHSLPLLRQAKRGGSRGK